MSYSQWKNPLRIKIKQWQQTLWQKRREFITSRQLLKETLKFFSGRKKIISERKLKIHAGIKSSEISKYIGKCKQTLTLILTRSECSFTRRKNLNIREQECTRWEGRKRGWGWKSGPPWRSVAGDSHPSHPQSLDYKRLYPPRYRKPRRDWEENHSGPDQRRGNTVPEKL